jgi:carboxypeptidase Taq
MSDPIKELKKIYQNIMTLTHIESCVYLDMETDTPEGGQLDKERQMAFLAAEIHKLKTNPEILELLTKARKTTTLSSSETRMVDLMERDYNLDTKLPSDFVQTKAKHLAQSSQAWKKARKNNDFKTFEPFLAKTIELLRQESEILTPGKNPYNIHLDKYEPGATTDLYDPMFLELKEFLLKVLPKIQENQKNTKPLVLKNLSVDKQREFSEFLLKHIGYDFNRGRLLETTHPYTIDLGFSDVRVSTRYEDDKSEFIKVALHEGGHALYEQGIDPDTKNSREMETYSIGFHESQSRIMEVYAGDTKAFWEFVYPKLQLDFAENFENVSLDQWLEHLRYVKPSPIRVEADEVTYNLHIIIRYEIEKDLITGVLDVADVPEVWNQKYKDYLGIDIASDSQGCLQDVHWSEALFGYFPTYSFGNVVAAQIWEFYRTGESRTGRISSRVVM